MEGLLLDSSFYIVLQEPEPRKQGQKGPKSCVTSERVYNLVVKRASVAFEILASTPRGILVVGNVPLDSERLW